MLRPLTLSTLALVAFALTSATPPAAPAAADTVGTKFRVAPVNALGITGFPDLRGKPVLVDFWGTR